MALPLIFSTIDSLLSNMMSRILFWNVKEYLGFPSLNANFITLTPKEGKDKEPSNFPYFHMQCHLQNYLQSYLLPPKISPSPSH